MNELQIFNNEEFGEIRTVTIDNEPWFVGKDVAEALGYAEPRSAVSKKVEECDRGVAEMETPSGKQKMTTINESGLYALIFGSKLESAKRFKHWVTSEVLPSIRKTGGYDMKQPQGKELLTIFNNQMDGIARGILEAFGIKSNAEPPKPKTPLWYQAHVSGKGWMDAVNGDIAGTVGQNRALEAIKIDMRKLNFKIKARAHIQNIGLKDFGYIKHDTVIGTTGKGLHLEAIELIAEGLKGKKLQTRVHIQDIGWTRWTSGMIGTVGMNKKIEAIEIRLV